eukprot:9497706-Pyramimonas_sp.AAC.2
MSVSITCGAETTEPQKWVISVSRKNRSFRRPAQFGFYFGCRNDRAGETRANIPRQKTHRRAISVWLARLSRGVERTLAVFGTGGP